MFHCVLCSIWSQMLELFSLGWACWIVMLCLSHVMGGYRSGFSKNLHRLLSQMWHFCHGVHPHPVKKVWVSDVKSNTDGISNFHETFKCTNVKVNVFMLLAVVFCKIKIQDSTVTWLPLSLYAVGGIFFLLNALIFLPVISFNDDILY